MQLKQQRVRMPVRPADAESTMAATIAAATCGLLGAAQPTAVLAADAAAWDIDSALFYYGESDGRVQDISAHIDVRYALDEDRKIGGNIAVDTLTGASPSGAVPTNTVQTFTRPSGNGSYQIAAGVAPTDDTFRDTRIAAGANWLQPIGELSRLTLGFTGSTEYDYLHLGLNARFERDFSLRNTTVFGGLAYASDSIDPVGGAPIPFAAMQPAGNNSSKLGSESKTVLDGMIGVTQILSRRAVLELDYSYSKADGYLNDPYKILSVVDPVSGLPVAGPGTLNRHLYENRPDSRTKQSLYAEYRFALDRDSFALGYRYMTDDWGIASHTLDARYRWNGVGRGYLEPHVRYYVQSAADFYQTYLRNGAALPRYASADYRLADMNALTVGLKYGRKLGGGEFTARLEYYKQTAEASPGSSVGALAAFDLVPPLSAVLVQFGYRFGL